jgi:hypothetical protein
MAPAPTGLTPFRSARRRVVRLAAHAAVWLTLAPSLAYAEEIKMEAKPHREQWHYVSNDAVAKDYEWVFTPVISTTASGMSIRIDQTITKHFDGSGAGLNAEIGLSNNPIRSLRVTFADGRVETRDGDTASFDGAEFATKAIASLTIQCSLLNHSWTVDWGSATPPPPKRRRDIS